MLEPSERKVFFEMLQPPDEGYQLDEAVATTFTLDLVTLLTAPLAFTSFECMDAEGKPTSDPVLLLEALRRNADKLTVFCQAGRAVTPSQQGILYNYLEQMVVEVTAPLGGVFHPKIWLIRYSKPEALPVIRLVVLSRNVTGDRSWDISLVMDGEVQDRKVGYGAHAPLADFLLALPDLAVTKVDQSVRDRVAGLAEDARRADFEFPEGFDEYQFVPLGLKKSRQLPFPGNKKQLLVVSPFLSGDFLARLVEEAGGDTLVSRLDELAKLPKEALAPFDKVYTLAPTVETVEPTDDSEEADQGTLTGLHAKVYLIDHDRRSTLYVGSANATDAAFGKNVEFLVGLTGKRSRVGVDRLLERTEGEASFLDLLTPYEPPDEPIAPDPVEVELEKRLDDFRLTLATGGLRAKIEPDGEQYTEELVGASGVSLPAGVTASLWPITVPEHANARPVGTEDTTLRFGPLPLAAITSFFGVHAKASAEGQTLEIRFTLNLPLENVPAGRREAIMGALLDDPEKFLRFLQFLLGDLNDFGAIPTGMDDPEGSSFGSWGPASFVLFESLLRALKDDPKRLDYVASAVDEMQAATNGADRLPAGFLPIWEAVWAARQEISA